MQVEDAVAAIDAAKSWEDRIAVIRRIPEDFGTALQAQVYGAVARQVYAPRFDPDFAYIHWPAPYELEVVKRSYADAHRLTREFSETSVASVERALLAAPRSLLAFRLIIGFTANEFAEAVNIVADENFRISRSRISSAESGKPLSPSAARFCALAICSAIAGKLFGSPPPGMRTKLDKPDTLLGWKSVRKFASSGVPLDVFLHQRLYGGSFNQLLNATGKLKGDYLETALADLFDQQGIRYVRTGSSSQGEIKERFGLTVRPAPDFVVYDRREALRAILECKAANDGGTARDKASRFRSLRNEATKLGGVPVFAVLSGIGWRRASDALGPVVRDTDGRVFAPATLPSLLTAQPFTTLLAEKN